jgi:hypothetical protein
MGVEALCKGLKAAGSSGLKELDLSHTAADDKAAAALAGLLSSSRVLERLVLTHTAISDAGAQLLCNALQVSCVQQAGLRNRGPDGGPQAQRVHVLRVCRVRRQAQAPNRQGAPAGWLQVHTGLTHEAAGSDECATARRVLLSAPAACSQQGNTTLQSINVSNNDSMDKSWQKLLNHLVKGKAKN